MARTQLQSVRSMILGIGVVTVLCSLLAISKVRRVSPVYQQEYESTELKLQSAAAKLDWIRIYVNQCSECPMDSRNGNQSYMDVKVQDPSFTNKTLYVSMDRNASSLPSRLFENPPNKPVFSQTHHSSSASSSVHGICPASFRSQYIKERCAAATTGKTSTQKSPGGLQNFILDIKHNLAYCLIYKCSSTTIIHMLNAANGGMNKEQLQNLQKKNPIANSVHTLPRTHRKGLAQKRVPLSQGMQTSSLQKFAIVRHPFDRLISCYLDKVAKNHDRYFRTLRSVVWNNYSPLTNVTIRTPGSATKYHQALGREPYNTQQVTFPMFVHFIIDYQKSRLDRKRWRGIEPGHFAHFNSFNDHCHFCHINYEYILRTETLDQDLLPILDKLNLSSDFVSGLTFNRFQTRTKSIKDGYVLDLFKDISLEQINALYKIYLPDFEIFGYTFNPDTKVASCRIVDKDGNKCC